MIIRRSVDPILIFACALAIAGCATGGRPIHATTLVGDETFTGTVTGPADGDGTVALTGSRGTKCSGKFTHLKLGSKTVEIGNLDLTCDDGRKGGVILSNASSDEINGFGTLGKELFILGDAP